MSKQTEALKRIARDDTEHGVEYYRADEADALLAEQPAQPEQEPVATVIKSGVNRTWMSEALGQLPDGTYSLYTTPPAQPAQKPDIYPEEACDMGLEAVAYYTSPPEREWIELTDASIQDCYNTAYKVVQGRRFEVTFARAVLAKSKELNT